MTENSEALSLVSLKRNTAADVSQIVLPSGKQARVLSAVSYFLNSVLLCFLHLHYLCGLGIYLTSFIALPEFIWERNK